MFEIHFFSTDRQFPPRLSRDHTDPIDVRKPVFDAFFGRSIVLRIISIFVKKFFTIFKNCSPIYPYVPSFLKSENLYINKNFLNFLKSLFWHENRVQNPEICYIIAKNHSGTSHGRTLMNFGGLYGQK